MNPFEQLTAPLLHVKRQFLQNCLFRHADGAVFLSTPEMVTTVQTHVSLQGSNDVLILLDVSGYPTVIPSNEVNDFLVSAKAALFKATELFNADRTKAEAQFQSLLTLNELDDEKTE